MRSHSVTALFIAMALVSARAATEGFYPTRPRTCAAKFDRAYELNVAQARLAYGVWNMDRSNDALYIGALTELAYREQVTANGAVNNPLVAFADGFKPEDLAGIPDVPPQVLAAFGGIDIKLVIAGVDVKTGIWKGDLVIETPGRRDIVRSLSLQGFATSEHNGGVRLTASYKATNVEMRISRDGCAIVKVANGFEALPSGVDLSYLSVASFVKSRETVSAALTEVMLFRARPRK